MPFLLSLHSYADWGLLALRLAIGAIFWVHGRSKAGMWKMQPSPQMPAGMLSKLKLLSICEPLAALALFAGLMTQAASFGLALVMVSAIYMKAKKWDVPFNANDKVGWEFDLILLAGCIMLILAGGGAWSLDRMWFGL